MNARPSNRTSNRTSTQNAVTKYGVRSHIRPVQALSLQAVHSTRAEFVRNAGTLAYMAPEQTGRMNRSIDTRVDLYSLRVTLYEPRSEKSRKRAPGR
jgi:serine/threonine protein kinase